MIFIDTSAWYALSSVRDANHQQAKSLLESLNEPLVTTDYVIDETLTLFRARGERLHALAFGVEVIEGSFAQIITVDESDFANAWTDNLQVLQRQRMELHRLHKPSRHGTPRYPTSVRVRRTLPPIRHDNNRSLTRDAVTELVLRAIRYRASVTRLLRNAR